MASISGSGVDPTNSGAQPGNTTYQDPASYGGLVSGSTPGATSGQLAGLFSNQNPQAGFYNWLNGQGLGGNSSVGQYSQNQYSRYYNQYLSYLPYMTPTDTSGNPTNTFLSYLQQSKLNPSEEYYTQGARQQGQSPFLYASRAKWTPPS